MADVIREALDDDGYELDVNEQAGGPYGRHLRAVVRLPPSERGNGSRNQGDRDRKGMT